MTDQPSLRLDHFMAAANAAYYANKDPFSDFITAPEISQIFGELIATWVIVVARSCPCYDSIMLVEAGPGRGTLMSDVLRVIAKAAPEVYARCSVHLIETSPRLRHIQKQALSDHPQITIEWHDSVQELPACPMILLANEFLDALPIRQFVCREHGQWAEHYVKNSQLEQQFVQTLPQSPIFKRSVKQGDIVEVCEVGQEIVAYVAHHISVHGGVALFIDYGYASMVWGYTLQAIANQKMVSPLVPAGTADLTAHIDFLALKEIAEQENVKVCPIQTQGEFLKQLGLIVRAKTLAAHATEEEKEQISQAVYRLSDPQEMGDLFKVMAIYHPDLPTPPAFEMNKEETL